MDERSYQYLESQVMTATPQKLRLMLIDGAIRWANQTLELWQSGQPERATEALIHCRAILRELLAGVRVDESELTRRVAAVYLFLLRSMTEAQLKLDRQRVLETIQVLEIERETWRMVCEQMPETPFPDDGAASPNGGPIEILAPSQGIDGPIQSAVAFDA
jgi:flagellar secretion chaperone FliS